MFSTTGRKTVRSISNVLRLSNLAYGDQLNLKKFKVIKSFDKTVDLYSKIHIETPMHVKITPIDLLAFPGGDRLTVTMLCPSKSNPSEFVIKQTPKRVDIIGSDKQVSSEAICLIQAPLASSIDVNATGKSSITINKMQTDQCNLKTCGGLIRVKDLKGKNIKMRSEEGSIQCEGTLLAEKIELHTESTADVVLQHIRANMLNVTTQEGSISTESCYCDDSYFRTFLGNLKLANIHKNCVIEILKRGNLTVTGFDGTMNATLKCGRVTFQASRLYDKNSIFVHEGGIVDVRISEEFKEMSLIDIIARKLEVAKEIVVHGKETSSSQHHKFLFENESDMMPQTELFVDCRNGSVELKLSSWQQMIEEK